MPRILLVAFFMACGSEPRPRDAAPAPLAALTARIVEGQCQGLGAGTAIRAGGSAETAPTERAKIELSDGTVAVLGAETKIVLLAGVRAIRIEKGEAVLDVPPKEGSPPLEVKLLRSEGAAVVTGTRLAVREDEGRALVDVSRGEVRLRCPRGEETVRAGEQGVMKPGDPPAVGPAPDLGATMSWAQAGATDEEAGIGSLRARDLGVDANATLSGIGRAATEHPLRLAQHAVKVRISGPVSRTEIEQTFANDTDRTLEGTYRFPIPSGARIAELAVDVDGSWRPGRFVDRSVGERIWRGVQKNARLGGFLGRVNTDDVLFAPGPWRDPALLAWEAGNRFSIRIHPIAPRSQKKVKIAWVETLPRTADGRRYVYPLPQGQWGSLGRSVADRISFDVRITGTQALRVRGPALAAREENGEKVLSLEAERFVPSGNVEIETEDASRAPAAVATYRIMQDLHAVVAIRPDLPRRESAATLEHVLLVDSSYSVAGETWRRQVAVVQALVREMDGADRVTVLACDIGCRPVGSPGQVPSDALAESLGDSLFRIEAGGTTDVVRMVEEGVRALTGSDGRRPSLVLLGDGASTVGARDPGRIGERVGRAVSEKKASVSTISVGSSADERTFAEVTRRTGGVQIAYAPGDAAPRLALRLLGRLRGAVLEGVTVTLPGAPTEVSPAALPAIRAGDEVWVAAKYASAASGDVVLRGSIDGEAFERRFPIEVRENDSIGNAFVPSMWAERRVVDLAAGGDANREAIVELGVRHGLVTPFTSLLVLDSDALAERLGLGVAITPTQWTGEGEAELEGAEPAADAARSRAPGAAGSGAGFGEGAGGRGDIAGLEGLGSGSIGLGRSGGRSGQQVPVVRQGAPAVNGALDINIVRRVVRQHINRFKFCYERQLLTNPALRGRISIQFTIGADGRVTSAAARENQLGEPAAQCMLAGFRAMTFPTPETGTVTVTFPMTFEQGEAQPSIPSRGGWGGWSGGRFATLGELREEGVAAAPERQRRDIEALRAKVAAEPDRRKHHRDLARALARVGEIDDGTNVARAWLARDAMDTEALTILADFLARGGDRDRAQRMLASVAEVQPGDKASHERMAKLYERAGRLDDACAHRVTLAALSPTDDAAAAAATRCEGEGAAAPEAENARGDLVVEVDWTGDVDLDAGVVTNTGTRASWMGGRRGVRAKDATSRSHEQIAFGFLPQGGFRVEVVRTGSGDAAVEGNVRVWALGEERRFPFRLAAGTRRVGVATVTVQGGGFGRFGGIGWGG